MIFFLFLPVALLVYLFLKEKHKSTQLKLELQFAHQKGERLDSVQKLLEESTLQCARLEERLHQAGHIEEKLKGVFGSLSREALEKNNRSFLELANNTFDKLQMKESLQKLDAGLHRLEKERQGDRDVLREQMRLLQEGEKALKQETANLVKALRTPLARGRWGEIQLRRVVELAGMLNHCDFFEQTQNTTGEERFRPDLIVRLPGGRQVVIDAKVPLEAYLEAIHTDSDEKRKELLALHARQVRAHVVALGRKAYWENFQPTPEFVVLFLPAETFFSAALEMDPTLIEVGAEQNVIIATPTTLIALLRAVSYGWKQENLSRQVEKMHELGQELYKRLADMNAHFSKMGRALTTTVEAYNKGIGSFESRVLVTARKFKEMGVAPSQIELDEIETVDKITREIASQDLTS